MAAKGVWTDLSDNALRWQKFAYVNPEGRLLVTIINYNDGPVWCVWLNGAGYGEYMTKEAAMAQAEKVA